MSKIKTFRGRIADDSAVKIPLHGDMPEDGYRITKFQIIPARPGSSDYEYTCKVYKTSRTGFDNIIDFEDDTLMAAAVLIGDDNQYEPISQVIVFDRMVVNQDIYVTSVDTKQSEPINYYLELEQVKMSKGEQAVVNFVAALDHGE